MKNKNIILLFILLAGAQASNAQIGFPKALKQAANSVMAGSPGQLEISSALKNTLELGVSAGSDRLSAQGGFLANAAVKLLFPAEAQKAEKSLRALGLNKVCDDFILSLNRAAELAVIEAKPIFISAIKQMNLEDASSILLSKEPDAATKYFQQITSGDLRSTFRPIIETALSKKDVPRHWAELSTRYNQIPLVTKVNTDISSYATQKAMEGLFYEIAKEELKMRQNSDLRNSPLLKKVFGYADNQKKEMITIN